MPLNAVHHISRDVMRLHVYTFVSGIDYQFPIRYDGDNMAIGIDLFLGAGYIPYKRIQIPNI